ncbi:MAG: hypothetical protein M1835_000215 [Candelina submexicana]|nr:MAG: hypothetical protein M1835_000215 [Candelina submexicana]
MEQAAPQACSGSVVSDGLPNAVVLDDSATWPIKPKSPNSSLSGQSHLFYLTENQEQPPHLVPQAGQAMSIASQDVAQWVADTSPHSIIEDNGAAYDALVEVYGVLMETSAEFREHMVKRADAKGQGNQRMALDELHEAWMRRLSARVNETLGHRSSVGARISLSDDLRSELAHIKSEATTGSELSNEKGKTKLEQLGEQITPNVQASKSKNLADSILQQLEDDVSPFVTVRTGTAATDEVVYFCQSQKSRRCDFVCNESSNLLSAVGEAAAECHTCHLGPDQSEYIRPTAEGSTPPVSYYAVNNKKLTLVAVSKSAKDALKAKRFTVVELPTDAHNEDSDQGLVRIKDMIFTSSTAKDGTTASGTTEVPVKSPSIVVSGHGNIINVICACSKDSLGSTTSEIIETTVAVNSSDKELSPKDVQLPSSASTQPSDKSSAPRSARAANFNATYVSLSSNHSSTSSLRTLRRRTECENLSAAADAAPPFPYETASPKEKGPEPSRAQSEVPQGRETMPIPQLAAQTRNASPSKAQAVGNTDPVKRRSTRAPPPPPINTASGFYKQSGSRQTTKPAYFSPEYPVSSNPSLLRSPKTPNMAAYPPLLSRSQASLTRAPPSVAPSNPLAGNEQPVFTEAGLAAAIVDEVPAGVSRGRYLEELNARLMNLEMEKARAVGRMWDDQRKIETLEEQVESLKARLAWYDHEWRRLTGVGNREGRDGQGGGGGHGDGMRLGGQVQGTHYHR